MSITYTRGDIIAQTTFTSPTNPVGQINESIEQAMHVIYRLFEFVRNISCNVNNGLGQPIKYATEGGSNKEKGRVAEQCGIDLNNPENKKLGMKERVEVKNITRASIIFQTITQLMAVRNYIYDQPEYKVIMHKQTPAMKDCKQVFLPAGRNCKIVLLGNKKGKAGNKIRTPLLLCHSLAEGNGEVLLAIEIMKKLLNTKSTTLDTSEYQNSDAALTILCGPFDHINPSQLDSGPAQAWSIARLSDFIWSHFTKCQNHPNVTSTAENWLAN